MAVYRNVHITFWTDTKVVDEFTPEDKYFMLYCLTNSYTNLCGCYEISIKQMSRDLGYNEETIINLLQRFSNIHKIIIYNEQNKELLIKNWFKYNWTKSEKLDKPLLKEIENIKTAEFKKYLVEEYNKRDTVSIPYIYPMDTTVSVSVTDTVSDNINIYEQNFGTLSPTIYDTIVDLENTYTAKYVSEAMKRAIINNKKSLAYVKGILKQWKNKTWDEIIQEEDKKENGNVPSWFNQNWDSKKEIEEVEEEPPKEPELEDYFDIFN